MPGSIGQLPGAAPAGRYWTQNSFPSGAFTRPRARARAEPLEPSHPGVYTRPTLLQRDRLTAPDVEVEVQAVLGHLPLRHALEVEARPDAVGILHGGRVVPALFGKAFGARPVVPARETVGRFRGPIVEGLGPELPQEPGIRAVEHDL